MNKNRVTLDVAAFADAVGDVPGVHAADVREIARRFLVACYDGIGKAPRLLDGEEMGALLGEVLPRYYGVKDRLGGATPVVLGRLVEHLEQTEVVPNVFELRQALFAHEDAFVAAVASGAVHQDGVVVAERTETIRNKAAKTGRNDPCPCGSGKKFKKCCGAG